MDLVFCGHTRLSELAQGAVYEFHLLMLYRSLGRPQLRLRDRV